MSEPPGGTSSRWQRAGSRRRPAKKATWSRRDRTKLGLLAVALVVAIGITYQLAARGSPTLLSTTPSAASGSTVRLMSPLGPTFAGDLVALRAGLFEREGLHLEMRAGAGADDPIASVVDGSDTFGITRSDSFLLARAGGAPIVAFAAGYIENSTVFYALKTSGLRNPGDFVGHRVGRRAGDETAIVYRAMITRLGLPMSRIVEVPVMDDLAPLLRGDVDVWPGHAGIEDIALRRLAVDYVLIDPASYGIHLPGTVYFTSERTLASQARTVQRFLKGVLAGWELVYADYAKSIPMIASFDVARLSIDDIRATLDLQRAYLRPAAVRFGEFSPAQWRSLQETLVSQRLIERSVDLTRAITYEFLREAYREPLSSTK